MLAMMMTRAEWAALEEKQAFLDVYHTHKRKALAVTTHILCSKALGEEAAQEGWIKVMTHFSKYLSIPVEKRAYWIVTIMSNTAKDIWRKEHKLATWDEPFDGGTVPGFSQAVDEAEAMAQHIAALPEGIRDVLVRRYYVQQTPGEIAKDMGLKSSTVSMRLKKGLALLKTAIEEEVAKG